MSKSLLIWDHFHSLLFPNDSENLKSLDIGLQEVGSKRQVNWVRNADTKKSCSLRQSLSKNKLFLPGIFTPLFGKSFQIWEHFFPLLFTKDSKSLKILDIWLQKLGAKRRLDGTSKVNTHTGKHKHMWKNQLKKTALDSTNTHTTTRSDIPTLWLNRPSGDDSVKILPSFDLAQQVLIQVQQKKLVEVRSS